MSEKPAIEPTDDPRGLADPVLDGTISAKPASAFEEAAADAPQESLLREFWEFLKHSKKWWLLPILAVLLLYGLIVLLYGTAAAPFIYTLF
jgi:hypothetical protein